MGDRPFAEAMILGGTLSQQLPADAQSGYVLFPLAIHASPGVVSACQAGVGWLSADNASYTFAGL